MVLLGNEWLQDVPDRIEEHDNDSDRKYHCDDDPDNHPGDGLDFQRRYEGDHHARAHKPDNGQVPGQNIRLPRPVGFKGDDADEDKTLYNDQNDNLHFTVRLAKGDEEGFGEESSEQRDEIPAPLWAELSPQWCVIWPMVEISPAECHKCGVTDETHNGKEEDDG